MQNRDSRIVIFTKKPGDANTENEGDVNYYGNDGAPSYCSIRFIYGDKGSLATTGFIIKKGKHYSSHMANDHNAGTSGGIVFRAAEAMLIYMEASYEKMVELTEQPMDIGKLYADAPKWTKTIIKQSLQHK